MTQAKMCMGALEADREYAEDSYLPFGVDECERVVVEMGAGPIARDRFEFPDGSILIVDECGARFPQ